MKSALAARRFDPNYLGTSILDRRSQGRIMRDFMTAPSDEIVVHVLDAATREPLSNASIHTSPGSIFHVKGSETLEGGAVFVRSSPEDVRAAQVGFAPLELRGASPLRLSRREGRIAWVTAAGYGWAHFFPDDRTCDALTVLLEPAVERDVEAEPDSTLDAECEALPERTAFRTLARLGSVREG